MVKAKQDLTGMIFGRLTVLCQTEDHIKSGGQHIAQWLCECSCEDHNIVPVVGDALKRGITKSCGCLQKEKAAETGKGCKKYNRYDLTGEHGVGWTSNTNKEFYFDLDRYDDIKDICWLEDKNGASNSRLYGRSPITGKPVLMHVLLGYKNYDHIDRNELNNLKSNLRKCTHQENMRNSSISKNNTSGFIGVSWNKNKNRWDARITIDYKTRYLGGFINKADAIKARLKAEVSYFGAFAPQRNLYETYGIIVRKETGDYGNSN